MNFSSFLLEIHFPFQTGSRSSRATACIKRWEPVNLVRCSSGVGITESIYSTLLLFFFFSFLSVFFLCLCTSPMSRLPHHPRLGRPFTKCETQENIKFVRGLLKAKKRKEKKRFNRVFSFFFRMREQKESLNWAQRVPIVNFRWAYRQARPSTWETTSIITHRHRLL